jgi:hypothetical protein
MSNSNRTQVRALKEVTWGTTPAAAMTNLNVTSESLGQNTDVVNSQFIRSDTNLAGVVRTAISAGGSLGVELQYGGYDELFEGALRSAWSTALNFSGTTITVAAADNSYTGSGGTEFTNAVVGQWVKVTGFTTAGNNGYAKVLTKTNAKITVSGLTLTNEASGDSVTIKGALLKNSSTDVSFTLEKEFADVTEFVAFTGMRVGSASLTIAPGSIITGEFAFQGKSAAATGATVGTGAANAAATTSSMNSVDNVERVFIDGVASTLDITEISLNINTNPRVQNAVGNLAAIGIGTGSIEVTGTLASYFESRAFYEKYLNFTAVSLAVVVEDGAGNAYVIDMPTVNFSAGNPQAGGINQDVLLPLNFSATLNASYGGTIGISRIPA